VLKKVKKEWAQQSKIHQTYLTNLQQDPNFLTSKTKELEDLNKEFESLNKK